MLTPPAPPPPYTPDNLGALFSVAGAHTSKTTTPPLL